MHIEHETKEKGGVRLHTKCYKLEDGSVEQLTSVAYGGADIGTTVRLFRMNNSIYSGIATLVSDESCCPQ